MTSGSFSSNQKKHQQPTRPSELPKGRVAELPISSTHVVLGTPMKGPWPAGHALGETSDDVSGESSKWLVKGFTSHL